MLETPQEWSEALPSAISALNSAKCSVTGVTPHFALFGQEKRMPLDLIYGNAPEPGRSLTGHLNHLTEVTQQIYKSMREKQNLSIARSSHQYNESDKNPLLIDDLVWLFTPRISAEKGSKLSTFWTGPWRIIRNI